MGPVSLGDNQEYILNGKYKNCLSIGGQEFRNSQGV